jgi:hypothetical protein
MPGHRFHLILVLMPALAVASEGQLDAARLCAQLESNPQRLECYDRVFQAGGTKVASSGQLAQPASPIATAPATATVADTPPASAVAPASSEEPRTNSRKEGDDSGTTRPASFEAKVIMLKETRRDVYRIWLDDGQVWQQMDMASLFQVAEGDTVRIEKARMGGYRMARVSKGRSAWVRVVRVD